MVFIVEQNLMNNLLEDKQPILTIYFVLFCFSFVLILLFIFISLTFQLNNHFIKKTLGFSGNNNNNFLFVFSTQ